MLAPSCLVLGSVLGHLGSVLSQLGVSGPSLAGLGGIPGHAGVIFGSYRWPSWLVLNLGFFAKVFLPLARWWAHFSVFELSPFAGSSSSAVRLNRTQLRQCLRKSYGNACKHVKSCPGIACMLRLQVWAASQVGAAECRSRRKSGRAPCGLR